MIMAMPQLGSSCLGFVVLFLDIHSVLYEIVPHRVAAAVAEAVRLQVVKQRDEKYSGSRISPGYLFRKRVQIRLSDFYP